MELQARLARRWAVAFVSALAVVIAGAGTASAGTAAAAAGTPRPGGGAGHAVSVAAQRAARAFWTPARMAAAAPLPAGRKAGGPAARPGIPSPAHFAGVPTVGALFLTTGTKPHFCTASVVKSKPEDLILTAAHCVYGSSYASNIEFVPKYHKGQQPYGAWPVKRIFVAAGWRHSHDPNLDFAFLAVTPPAGVMKPIQRVTGGLRLGINLGYGHQIEVIGYNNTDAAPVKCATSSFKFAANQMKFYCNDYKDGTSGGPWIIGYNGKDGTGTVFGVIGGYQQGGDHSWASYSAYFFRSASELFRLAGGQGQAAG